MRLVVPSALQMGWTESPDFFCSASETVRDVAEDLRAEPQGSLSPHPLEEFMLPPDQWPEEDLGGTCKRFLEMLEVYVDDFVALCQSTDVKQLRHISRALLQGIHFVFPSPSVTGHSGGDSISRKKV